MTQEELGREVERRTDAIDRLGETFNQTHDRARDEFFMPFVHAAELINGAPQPDPDGLGEDDDSPEGTPIAQEQLLENTHAVANTIGAGIGAPPPASARNRGNATSRRSVRPAIDPCHCVAFRVSGIQRGQQN